MFIVVSKNQFFHYLVKMVQSFIELFKLDFSTNDVNDFTDLDDWLLL